MASIVANGLAAKTLGLVKATQRRWPNAKPLRLIGPRDLDEIL
jgi:hypothetical protein